ncbi:substrate-binding domain-containing protein [Yinghuangia soli]|uniref:Substrate-binding domain-containing protein n=1 Tax=Yinghuangia soli TaxID=2908204 RepID=A0AA41TZI5_9ACTN|nr:substrate-binding domain-containing protein [Yinghuangia soli]MCF2528853.1 substrate-binding domain-containing protein [Yinghuangia soli]
MTDQQRGTGKRGPYRKSVELRREILDAALKVFARDGYRASSVRDIAEAAGITAPGLLHHFGSKSALLIEALRHREQIDGSFSAGRDLRGSGALLAVVELAEYNTRQRGLAELFCVLSAEATSSEHPAHEYFKQRYDWFRDYVGQGFAQLAEGGDLRPGVDPVRAARSTVALLDGLQTQWLLDPGAVDMPGDLRQYFRSLVTEESWALAVARRAGRADAPAAEADTADTAPGTAPHAGRTVTIQDIADRTGVSIASVSRALNGKPGVSAATRGLVVEAAKELGFTGSSVARALKSGRTGRIAVTLPWLDTPYTARILAGIAQTLDDHGYSLAVGTTKDQHGRVRPVLDKLGRHGFDGALVVLPPGGAKDLASPATAGRPVVVVDPLAEMDLPTVACDNVAGGAAAVRHLLALGHRRIGILTGEDGIPATRDRLAGARAVLAEAGVWDESLVRTCAFLDPATSIAATHALLAADDRPTAVFAMNDRLASGAYRAVAALGLEVPRDLAVVGFDDDQIAALLTPPLTTVRQPLDLLGAAAARLLLDRLDGLDDGAPLVALPPQLVVRDSTAAPQER